MTPAARAAWPADGARLLEPSVSYALGVVLVVTPELLRRPTPCREWDLRMLLRHACESLAACGGNPKVRAGVLRLVSALPDITVTHGTVDGQPTLTLTAGAAELGHPGPGKGNPKADTGPAYREAITINARTGIPLGFAGGPAGKVAVTITYVVTRVNLGDIAVGKS